MKAPSKYSNRWIKISVITLIIPILNAGCTLINRAPVINVLAADNDYLCMGASSEVHARATDPDNDGLTYTWVTPSGEIKGEGSSISWQAPSVPGVHAITLKVTDSRGRNTTETLTLNVLPNSLPIIERLEVGKAGCGGGESIPVECVALDPDGDKLIFRWTATGGEISGYGPAVSWTAPDKKGKYTVSVEVSDGNCGGVTGEKTIRVT